MIYKGMRISLMFPVWMGIPETFVRIVNKRRRSNYYHRIIFDIAASLERHTDWSYSRGVYKKRIRKEP